MCSEKTLPGARFASFCWVFVFTRNAEPMTGRRADRCRQILSERRPIDDVIVDGVAVENPQIIIE